MIMERRKYIMRTALLLIALCLSIHHAETVYAETVAHSGKAPDFTLHDLQGVRHRLSDYVGKVVLINFWASWCKECVAEIPSLNSLYKRFRDKGVVVLGVSIDRHNEEIRKSMQKVPVAYPVLVDRDSEVFSEKYTLIGLPTTVVIDKNGYITDKLIGRSDFGSAAFAEKMDILVRKKFR